MIDYVLGFIVLIDCRFVKKKNFIFILMVIQLKSRKNQKCKEEICKQLGGVNSRRKKGKRERRKEREKEKKERFY